MKRNIFIVIFIIGIQLLAVAQLNTDRVMIIGRNALYYKDYVLSIQYFNMVIGAKPYLYEPYMYRGIAKIQLGDYEGAESDCSESIRLNPFVSQSYYARGFARQRLKKYKEAEADFTKAIEFSPENDIFLSNRMYARAADENYSAAMDDLNQLTKLNPKESELLFEKGRLLLMMKDTIGAEQNIKQFLQKDSTSNIGWSVLAMIKLQQDDDANALIYLNKAIALNSTFVGDYINRGILNVRGKRYMQALSDYDKAIDMEKNNMLALYNRGLLRASLGDNNNALNDLDKVISIDSTFMEARLRRAMLHQTLRNYRATIADYKAILLKYPYFLPAYQGLANAEDALGNAKSAFLYREQAFKIEQNKNKIQQDQKKKDEEELKADNKIATNTQSIASNNTDFTNRFSEQSLDEEEKNDNTSLRGTVQDRYADIVNEGNYELTYYAKNNEIRRTPRYYLDIDRYNSEKRISNVLKITNEESPLTETLIQVHFEQINALSKQIAEKANADLYFNRAIEFALVKDFSAAIDDLNKAIELRPNFMLAYFERANIRYRLIESQKYSIAGTEKERTLVQAKYLSDKEVVLNDYERVVSHNPDFSFAYYNRANVLCSMREYTSAIVSYSRAITIEPDFAEAYFNRGLTYLYLGEVTKGLADLSKAGELGVFEAYNLIKRYKK